MAGELAELACPEDDEWNWHHGGSPGMQISPHRVPPEQMAALVRAHDPEAYDLAVKVAVRQAIAERRKRLNARYGHRPVLRERNASKTS